MVFVMVAVSVTVGVCVIVGVSVTVGDEKYIKVGGVSVAVNVFVGSPVSVSCPVPPLCCALVAHSNPSPIR